MDEQETPDDVTVKFAMFDNGKPANTVVGFIQVPPATD
jgi:hypothetical protein